MNRFGNEVLGIVWGIDLSISIWGIHVVVGLQIAPIQNLFGLALSVARAHG